MLSRVQYFLNRTTNWDCGPNSIERSVPETFFYSSSVFTSVHGRYHEHKNRFLERTCPTSRSHTTLVPRKTALRTKLNVRIMVRMYTTIYSSILVLYGTTYSPWDQILVSTPPFSRRWEHFSKIGLHGCNSIAIPLTTMEADFWVASSKRSFFYRRDSQSDR